jgi:hypothetical protein
MITGSELADTHVVVMNISSPGHTRRVDSAKYSAMKAAFLKVFRQATWADSRRDQVGPSAPSA